MKIAGTTLLILGLLRTALGAAESPADVEFKALQVISAPRPPSSGTLTENQAETERRQRIAMFARASDVAREFYEKYPSHPKASEARRIEAESLLRAAREGGVEHEAKAIRLARTYRSDRANSSHDRYIIAAAMRELDVKKQNFGQSKADLLAAYEKAAMDLYGEFSDEPAVFDLFLGVARNSDPSKARSTASQILLMPAPITVKDQAREIIARLDLPGKTIDVEWTDDQGTAYRLKDFKGKVVVFYLWATWAPSGDAEKKIKALPAAVSLVSVNLDQDIAKAKTEKSRAGIGGIAYYDNRGLNSPLPRQLHAAKVPGVCVISAKGTFVGEGGVDQLQALLDAAARQ